MVLIHSFLQNAMQSKMTAVKRALSWAKDKALPWRNPYIAESIINIFLPTSVTFFFFK